MSPSWALTIENVRGHRYELGNNWNEGKFNFAGNLAYFLVCWGYSRWIYIFFPASTRTDSSTMHCWLQNLRQLSFIAPKSLKLLPQSLQVRPIFTQGGVVGRLSKCGFPKSSIFSASSFKFPLSLIIKQKLTPGPKSCAFCYSEFLMLKFLLVLCHVANGILM